MLLTHLHLALVHAIIFGVPFGAILLAVGIKRTSSEFLIAGCLTFFLVALAAIPSFLSGDEAEEHIENIAGIQESVIDEHEDAAGITMYFVEALGILGLAALVLYKRKRSIPRVLVNGMLIVSIVATSLLVWTANLGGMIRHPEAFTNAP